MNLFLIVVSIVSLPMLFFLESLTWYVRSISAGGRNAWIMTRTSMILYFSRFFYLVYVTLIYYNIEAGAKIKETLTVLLLAFLTSTILQLIIFTKAGKYFAIKICELYKIEIEQKKFEQEKIIIKKLFIINTIAVIFIGLGIVVPVILAYIYPEKRMTLTVTYQVMNAFGTYILLSKIDPDLSERMDKDILNEAMYSFVLSRMLSFIIISLILLLLALINLK